MKVYSLEFSQQHRYPPQRVNDRNLFVKTMQRLGVWQYYDRCCVCGWQKCTIDLAHMVSHKDGGYFTYDNILPLCPNHHRQFERDSLSDYELEHIQEFLWHISNIISPFT